MRDTNDIMRERQRAIRREIDRRGIALKAIACDADMSMSTLMSYFPGGDQQPAIMSVTALFKIIAGNALPLDLVSMLLPSGALVVRAPEEIDHDELEGACREYLAAKGAAHHPASPAGREIAPCEDAALTSRAAVLKAVA